jgi:hypothetical protein
MSRLRVVSFLRKRIPFFLNLLAVLILIVFLIQAFGKAYRENGYDFTSYMMSSKAFFSGSNPYQTASPFPFIYPLFACIVIFPFALLPYWLSNLLWFVVNSLALYFSAAILIDLYARDFNLRFSRAVWFFPFIVLANPVQNNLLNGQINFIVLFLCVAFLRASLESRHVSASIFLAAAISIKLTPLVLLVYLIFRKDFLTAGLVIVATTVMIVLLPYLVSAAVTFQYYSYYLSSFIGRNVIRAGHGSPNFFSITAVLGSFFPPTWSLLPATLASILTLAPVIAVQLIARPSTNAKETVIFSMYMVAALLISPASETHHLIYLFPALLLITLLALQDFQNSFRLGLLTLVLVLVSLVSGRFLFPLNMIPIAICYLSMIWLVRVLKRMEQMSSLEGDFVPRPEAMRHLP